MKGAKGRGKGRQGKWKQSEMRKSGGKSNGKGKSGGKGRQQDGKTNRWRSQNHKRKGLVTLPEKWNPKIFDKEVEKLEEEITKERLPRKEEITTSRNDFVWYLEEHHKFEDEYVFHPVTFDFDLYERENQVEQNSMLRKYQG